MSTIRATYVQHGSSAVPNITLNASGQVIVASGIVSSGTFAAPTGSAAAPGVYFVGDTNTGLYSPGADQVAISTNGTGRLFVDASGNVGVGGAPTQLLQLGSFGGNDSNLQFAANTAGASNILFGDGSSGADFYRGLIKYNHATDSLELLASSYSTIITNGSERLRITSAGLVGIGTSTPGGKAHIDHTSGLPVTSGSTQTHGALRFGAGGTNAVLDIGNAGASGAWLQVTNQTSLIPSNSFPLLLNPNGGNVGIGTTSNYDDSVLEVRKASGGDGVAIRVTNDTTTNGSLAGIIFTNSTGDFTSAAIAHKRNDNALIFFNGQTAGGGGFANATEAMRLDSSNRLLVGTSTSLHHNAQIQTAGTGYYGYNHFQFSNDAFAPTISVKKSRSASVGGNTIVQDGDRLGTFSFFGADGSTFLQGADITAFVDGTPGVNDLPTRLVFSTTADGASSPTERMRIGSGGHLYATCSDTSLASLTLRKGAAGADGIDYLQCRDSGNTAKLVIASTGNVQNTNGSYTSFSDAKLKENIIDANSQWSDIKAVKIRNWNFKTETGYQTHRQIGPIAQELETICPNLVFDVPDRNESGEDIGTVTKGVNQSVLYMKAVKALQEAMERIETLEQRLNDAGIN
jgi:hypothetical protein